MPLNSDEIAAIARDVIRTSHHRLDLVGVTAVEGGSDRVELMITVRGCHAEPCRLLLNLSRGTRADLEADLRRKLETVLRTHITQPADAHD
jgi:hypothetical protein